MSSDVEARSSLTSFMGIDHLHGNADAVQAELPKPAPASIPTSMPKNPLEVDPQLFTAVPNPKIEKPKYTQPQHWEGVSARIADDYHYSSQDQAPEKPVPQSKPQPKEVKPVEQPAPEIPAVLPSADLQRDMRLESQKVKVLTPKWEGVSAQLEPEWLQISADNATGGVAAEVDSPTAEAQPPQGSDDGSENWHAAYSLLNRPPGDKNKSKVAPKEWSGISTELQGEFPAIPSPSPPARRSRQASKHERVSDDVASIEPKQSQERRSQEYVEQYRHSKPEEVPGKKEGLVNNFFDFSPLSAGLTS